MTERATCWSITINNATTADINVSFPMGWEMTGQMEKGENGTEHYQGMLTTPQVRFSAVKKMLPRAHIEVAKNRLALEQYVHKEESRIGIVADVKSAIPNMYDYIHVIARKWDWDMFQVFVDGENMKNEKSKKSSDDLAMEYIDEMINIEIRDGVKGIEWISINPNWRSAWKRHWRSIIFREHKIQVSEILANQPPQSSQTDRQTDGDSDAPAENKIVYP